MTNFQKKNENLEVFTEKLEQQQICGIEMDILLQYWQNILDEEQRRQKVSPSLKVYDIITALREQYPYLSNSHPKLNTIILKFSKRHFFSYRTKNGHFIPTFADSAKNTFKSEYDNGNTKQCLAELSEVIAKEKNKVVVFCRT